MPSNLVPQGSNVRYADHFGIQNHFVGMQLGLSSQFEYGPFSLTATGKMGLGLLSQDAHVDGNTILRAADGTTTAFPGGVLASPNNLGTFSRDRFAAVPELTLQAGYDIAPHLRALVGYDFLYLSSAARPGNSIGSVDSGQVPQVRMSSAPVTTAPATFRLQDSSIWAQGLTCGLEWRY